MKLIAQLAHSPPTSDLSAGINFSQARLKSEGKYFRQLALQLHPSNSSNRSIDHVNWLSTLLFHFITNQTNKQK